MKLRYNSFLHRADTIEPEEELTAIIKSQFSIKLEITDDDRTKLKDLMKKPSLIQVPDSAIATSLIDIVFAYCYDQRVNDWESTCESGWSCAKLSPSLSYLAKFGSARQSIIAAAQRAISYSLYRSFELAVKVIDDTTNVFQEGRCALLHVLCDLHRIFATAGEFRYILNDLFITDFLIWIQSVPDSVIANIQKELKDMAPIAKADLGWDLDVLETEARMERAHLDSDDDPDG